MIDNQDRAEYAQQALETFVENTATQDEPAADQIADLMANLMHLAKQQDLDPHALVQRATWNFEAEINE